MPSQFTHTMVMYVQIELATIGASEERLPYKPESARVLGGAALSAMLRVAAVECPGIRWSAGDDTHAAVRPR